MQDETWLPDEQSNHTGTETHVASILARIEAFQETQSWSDSYFGKIAAGDVHVLRRMRETGKIEARTIARIERFLGQQAAE